MTIVLRIIGGVWVLLTAREVIALLHAFLTQGIRVNLGITQILSLTMLAGGIGLLFLKEWGRWVLLIGSVAFLLVLVGPTLLRGNFGPVVLRHFVFYGVFIALLLIPPAKAATR